jgi:hypothetical protein
VQVQVPVQELEPVRAQVQELVQEPVPVRALELVQDLDPGPDRGRDPDPVFGLGLESGSGLVLIPRCNSSV